MRTRWRRGGKELPGPTSGELSAQAALCCRSTLVEMNVASCGCFTIPLLTYKLLFFFPLSLPLLLPLSSFSSAPPQLSDGPRLRRGSDGYRLHPALLLQSAAGSAAHLQSGQGQQDTVGKENVPNVWALVCFFFLGFFCLSLISLLHAKKESGAGGEMQTMKASGGAER